MSIKQVVFTCDRCQTEGVTEKVVTPPADWVTAHRVDPIVGPTVLHFCKACADTFVTASAAPPA